MFCYHILKLDVNCGTPSTDLVTLSSWLQFEASGAREAREEHPQGTTLAIFSIMLSKIFGLGFRGFIESYILTRPIVRYSFIRFIFKHLLLQKAQIGVRERIHISIERRFFFDLWILH